MNAPLKILALVIAVLALADCGGGGGAPDTQAPSATIIFPPAVSLTEADRVTVRGTASDNGTIAAVRVNGIDAISIDGFATWQASVPLVNGQNTLVVETVDMASNADSSAAEALITRTVLWASPVGIAIDETNNRALVVDSALNTISAVDLTTGASTMVSKASVPTGSTLTILASSAQAIVLDSENDRALVADAGRDAILAIDLATGARTTISDRTKPDDTNLFSIPTDLVLDAGNGRVLVTDRGLDALLEVDLGTGARKIISDASRPVGGANAFSNPEGVALDSTGNRALVVDRGLGAVLAVDLATGARTIVSGPSSSGDPLIDPRDIVVDHALGRAYVVDFGAVISVDLDSGERTTVSDLDTPLGGDNRFLFPRGIGLVTTHNRALVVDSQLDAVMAVDLTSGARTILAKVNTPNESNPLRGLSEITLDNGNTRVLVVDSRKLVAVDLANGARTVISDDSRGGGVALRFPLDIALGSADRGLIVDDGLDALVAVDLSTGARTIVSDASTPAGGANPFSRPVALAFDGALNRALVVDSDLDAVLAVDLATGTRTIVSNASTAGEALIDPGDIALDSANDRALVLEASLSDVHLRGVVNVDLASGERTVLSSNAGVPDDSNRFTLPRAIALDAARNRALVVNDSFAPGRDALIAVDLMSGARTVVSDANTPDGNTLFTNPRGIVVDSATNQAVVADVEWSAVFMVDLMTGERVVLSK